MAKKRKSKKKKFNKSILTLLVVLVIVLVLIGCVSNPSIRSKVNVILAPFGIQIGETIESNNKTTITTNKNASSSSKKTYNTDESEYLKNALITGEHVSLSEDGCVEDVVYENFEIHFLELGNEYAGDSTYIKAGNVDILIDAGSRQNSATTIIEYVNKYCEDGVLEYVIATHAHQDHIAGFIGNSKTGYKNSNGDVVDRTGIMYYYEIETLIDFSLSDVTSKLYTESYADAVKYLENNGTKHYKAGDCFNNTNGAKSHYVLDETLNISFDIIYNKYYYEKSSDENNYSVCTMFNYNDYHFLLTGDLEDKGEESISDYYDGTTEEKTLPHVELFKAGHHGSATSSNDCLLSKITPNICAVCTCAGSNEYTNNLNNIFPTQKFIDRISKYTDRVYVTTLFNEETMKNESMNGNIIISSNGNYIGIYATNNLIKLKDTEWFNAEVYCIYDNSKDIYYVCEKLKASEYYNESTIGAIKVKRRTWKTK